MMARKNQLYQHVITITQDYLGPAAERFIERQIEVHLQKNPEDLTRRDLKPLINWIELAMALLTDNHRIVEEYISSLASLTKNTR